MQHALDTEIYLVSIPYKSNNAQRDTSRVIMPTTNSTRQQAKDRVSSHSYTQTPKCKSHMRRPNAEAQKRLYAPSSIIRFHDLPPDPRRSEHRQAHLSSPACLVRYLLANACPLRHRSAPGRQSELQDLPIDRRGSEYRQAHRPSLAYPVRCLLANAYPLRHQSASGRQSRLSMSLR